MLINCVVQIMQDSKNWNIYIKFKLKERLINIDSRMADSTMFCSSVDQCQIFLAEWIIFTPLIFSSPLDTHFSFGEGLLFEFSLESYKVYNLNSINKQIFLWLIRICATNYYQIGILVEVFSLARIYKFKCESYSLCSSKW